MRRLGLLLGLLISLAGCSITISNSASSVARIDSPTRTSVPLTSTQTPQPSRTSIPPTSTALLARQSVPPTNTPPPTTTATLCDNAYYPVNANSEWKYRTASTDGKTPSAEHTLTYTNISPNSFIDHRVFSNLLLDNPWSCTPQGLIAGQVPNVGLLASPQFKIESLQPTGVTVPPANAWKIGTTWTNGYTVKGTMVNGGQTMTAQGPIEITNKIVTQETVKVPAGSFTAFRVDGTLKSNLTTSLGFIDVPVNIDYASSSWYVQNIGLVKMTTTGTLGSVTELTSFKYKR